MLRPDRRTRRAFAGIFVTITALALIWPASIAAGRTASSATLAGHASTGAPQSTHQPTVHGLGRQPFKANAGEKRSKPLQHLATNNTNRGTSDKTRGLRAPAVSAVTPPASVQATASGAPAATSFGAFEGINQATSTFEPPDPWVAVGPDDVVQSTNTMLRFSNREGTATAGNVQLFDFFAFDQLVPGQPDFIDGIGDPHWLYDAKHNRWLGTTLAWHCDTDGAGTTDDSLGFVWGAISLTGDPTGDYYQFYILYNSFLPDFPSVGTSADKFAVTANEFILTDQPDCTANIPFDGGSVMAFDWAQMLTSPALPDGTYEFDNSWFALRPAVQPQSQSNALFVVGEKLLPSPAGDTTSNVLYMNVTGTNAAGGTTLSGEQDLTALGVVPGFVDPPVPIQPPGGALDANTIDRRPTDAIWQGNVLTVLSTTGCDPAGGAVETRDCARVTQVNTTTSTPTRVQDMLIATSAKDTWYPGAGISQSGILHVVYTQSGSTQGMSSLDRYQLPSNAKHTLSTPVLLASGGVLPYPGKRWGDFVGVAQDPRDTNAVWQGNQYTASPGNWSTKVSELQTAGSTFKPVTPVRLLDSRVNLGTTGPFTSSIPKTIQIAGRLGIPSNAVAITGNLTVTGQQQAGYASLTRVPDANPATSTINFPLGDNRANNVTSPLSSTGAVSIVYKAGAGKQTHFLLDVTGYFLNDSSGSTYKVLAPVRVLDTRAGAQNIGLAGPVPANQNKEFKVAGVKTVPASAVAVTANLTITSQTRGGFVTLSTTAPPTNPATSTINFPVGDTRANGVTVKLSPTGTLWVVYKAAPGATTQIIFDVTGYYVQDLTGARFVPLTPGRRMDTRFAAPRQGLTGAFVSHVPRSLVVVPYQGVPGDATAVTGNLTVVSPTRAGYVSMTATTVDPPPTANINFPAGDIRGNGVTGPLSGAGTVAFDYVASGGTTHLVFDLTGYFR